MASVLAFFLRTRLGREGVMQRLHFLVGFLKQSVDQFNACMQFHAYAPWQGVFRCKSTIWRCRSVALGAVQQLVAPAPTLLLSDWGELTWKRHKKVALKHGFAGARSASCHAMDGELC